MEKKPVHRSSARKRALEGAAQAEQRSEADLIREGIETVTARTWVAEPTPPLFDSGRPDLAAHVDEYLGGFGEK
jgi:hypothetical protein